MNSLKERINIIIARTKLFFTPGASHNLRIMQERGARYVIAEQIPNCNLGIPHRVWEFDLYSEKGQRRFKALTRLANMSPKGRSEKQTILDSYRGIIAEIEFTK